MLVPTLRFIFTIMTHIQRCQSLRRPGGKSNLQEVESFLMGHVYSAHASKVDTILTPCEVEVSSKNCRGCAKYANSWHYTIYIILFYINMDPEYGLDIPIHASRSITQHIEKVNPRSILEPEENQHAKMQLKIWSITQLRAGVLRDKFLCSNFRREQEEIGRNYGRHPWVGRWRDWSKGHHAELSRQSRSLRKLKLD